MTNEEFNRARDRTLELHLMREQRKLTQTERDEFAKLLEDMFLSNSDRLHQERERRELKKKRVRPRKLLGIH
jgi:hypothetical protein